MEKRNDLSCPKCRNQLVYDDSFDMDTGKRDNAWYECSNSDCDYRCGADSLHVGAPTPARGFDQAPKELPVEVVPFHEAKIPSRETVNLIGGHVVEFSSGRRIEVWRIVEDDGPCVRIFRPTDDGKVSCLAFGLSQAAATALASGLLVQLGALGKEAAR